MSVLINDFDVIPESPGDGTDGEEEAASDSPSARVSIRPGDVIEVVERRARRRRRLRAH